MTKGKSICNVLKTIRKQVADANNIKYEPRECHHQGDCRGTCPACEAEVRYLEQQLERRRQLGRAVCLVGVSAGLAALAGCSSQSASVHGPKPTPPTEGEVEWVPTRPQDDSIERMVLGRVDPVPVRPDTSRFVLPVMEGEVEPDSVSADNEL